MADYGFKVSKAGQDVVTASDDNLALSSKFNMFKSSLTGTFNVTVNGFSTVTTNIAHGLAYSPSFQVFLEGDIARSYYCPGDNGTLAFYIIPDKIVSSFCFTDSTNLSIDVGNSDASQRTFTVRYYIYKDEVI